ncbi:hypothetical protein GIB67_015616 [Kingdonia uniflora]|uniref:Dof zinc finger protein n=1 Tax=Kingdonia uniflora TaxID=39325 RepID=A0A7J7NUL9_9MAGN|nr:hypothetical protein GIB67_015616 [Kingdonia uniflora]
MMNQQGEGGGGCERILEAKPPLTPPSRQPLKCPRCESVNTRFCYYNNHCVSQPRYFCKTCRRSWTEGGILRYVPASGSSRKEERSSTKKSPSSSSTIYSPSFLTATPAPSLKSISSSSSLTPPIYYSSGGLMFTPQPFNQIGNIGINIGGSSLGLPQGFSLPSFTTPQQQQHQQHQHGLMRNLIHHPNRSSTRTQDLSVNPPLLSSQAQGPYWRSSNNNKKHQHGLTRNPVLCPKRSSTRTQDRSVNPPLLSSQAQGPYWSIISSSSNHDDNNNHSVVSASAACNDGLGLGLSLNNCNQWRASD